MDERERRLGENEVLFRSVNERLEDLNQAFAPVSGKVEFVCECGSGTCVARLDVSLEDYERVRSHGAHFLLVPGHEQPDVEYVVERGDDFVVVEKRSGGPQELAEAYDPRD